jgi:hypothetical protein
MPKLPVDKATLIAWAFRLRAKNYPLPALMAICKRLGARFETMGWGAGLPVILNEMVTFKKDSDPAKNT